MVALRIKGLGVRVPPSALEVSGPKWPLTWAFRLDSLVIVVAEQRPPNCATKRKPKFVSRRMARDRSSRTTGPASELANGRLTASTKC